MQSKGKIAIFSKGSFNPLHPRIALEFEVLKASGYDVKLFTPQIVKTSFKARLLNLLTLSLFKWELVFEFSKFIPQFETIIIYDTHLLPLGKYREGENKQVIFETLDDNVELVCYHIFKKLPFLKLFESSCRKYLKKRENYYLKNYFDNTIVNSKRLLDVFKVHQPVLNYYCSPFEKSPLKASDIKHKPALIYLGKISADKGLSTMLNLAKKNGLKIFLFGDLDREDAAALLQEIIQYPQAVQVNKLSVEELLIEVQKLAEAHHLIGLSLIESVHISYKFQDANKDIDYLALNIPFIGNSRPTTKFIIDDGCGALVDNQSKIKALIESEHEYKRAVRRCGIHYKKQYSQDQFTTTLLKVLN
jgi:hypothetical protein